MSLSLLCRDSVIWANLKRSIHLTDPVMDKSPIAKRSETSLQCAPNDMDDENYRLDNVNAVLDIVDDEPSSISTAVHLLAAIDQMSEELGVLDPNFGNATKPSTENIHDLSA